MKSEGVFGTDAGRLQRCMCSTCGPYSPSGTYIIEQYCMSTPPPPPHPVTRICGMAWASALTAAAGVTYGSGVYACIRLQVMQPESEAHTHAHTHTVAVAPRSTPCGARRWTSNRWWRRSRREVRALAVAANCLSFVTTTAPAKFIFHPFHAY